MATWADLQDALHRAHERTGNGPGGAEVAEAIALAAELKAQAAKLAHAAHEYAAIAMVLGVNAGQAGAAPLNVDAVRDRLDPFRLYARRTPEGSTDGT